MSGNRNRALGYKDGSGNYGFVMYASGSIKIGNDGTDVIAMTGSQEIIGRIKAMPPTAYNTNTTLYRESFEGLTADQVDPGNPATNGTWTNGAGSKDGSSVANGYPWQSRDGGTTSGGTGPNAADSGSIYVFTEASSRSNKYYVLERSFTQTQASEIGKMSFFYHMHGDNFGSLHISASANGSDWTGLTITKDADGSPSAVSSISGQQQVNQSDDWKRAEVDLTPYLGSALYIRINGYTGNGYESDTAIDAIEFMPAPYALHSTSPVSASSYYGDGSNLVNISDSSLASNCVTAAKVNTSVVGNGLTGGGGSALAVGAGTGVTVNANDVAIGQAVGTGDTVEFSKVKLNTSTIGGNEVMRVLGSGDNFNTLVVFGADTTTEYVSLGINSSGNPTIAGGYSNSTQPSNLCFATQEGGGEAEAVKMILNNEGSLGIGLSTAINYGQLEVYKNSSTSAANITIHQDHASGDSRLHLRSDANDWYIINDGGDDDLRFHNESTERMRLTNGGRLGIGTDNPSYLLDVSGEMRTTTGLTSNGTLHCDGNLSVDGSNNSIAGLLTINAGGGSTTSPSYNDAVAFVTHNDYWYIYPKRISSSTTNVNLQFNADGTDYGYIDDGGSNDMMNFTGQHRCLPDSSTDFATLSGSVGKIVVSSGQYDNPNTTDIVTINESIPTIKLSNARNQKSAFGVISNSEDPNQQDRTYNFGAFGTNRQKKDSSDVRLHINSLGEGGIWISNINGNLENGDYITTCEIPGYGMKQDDDLLHNYTVAKITQDCDFDLNSNSYECVEISHDGSTYRTAFVGCTYHCG